MNERHRQMATFIIWFVFLIAVLMVLDRVLMVSADFYGVWPESPSTYPLAQDAELLNQAIAGAREAAPTIFPQVQESIRVQFAQRVPLATALTFMLTLAATLCTCFIWRNAGLEAYLAREAVQVEKVKRRSRIEQFVEDLGPDELVQLRTRLVDDEGDAKAKR